MGGSSILNLIIGLSIINIISSFILKVSIQAAFLKYFARKQNIIQGYGKAWIVIFSASIIVLVLSIIGSVLKMPIFVQIIISLLFFVLLIFTSKIIYKIDTKTSSILSAKLFILSLVILTILAGLITLIGVLDHSPADCKFDCSFSYSRNDYTGVLTVTGFNIPYGKINEKEDYIITNKTFKLDGTRLKGKLDSSNCNYMEFSEDDGSYRVFDCDGGAAYSRYHTEVSNNYLTNLKKYGLGI